MNILIISLLRMGDLILLNRAIQQLKVLNPEAKIHILTNRSNEGIVESLGMADRAFYFDRAKIQKSIGSAEDSFFEAYDRIEDLLKRVNSKRYDFAYNLTHNKLSAYLFSQIDATEKHGLEISTDGNTQIGGAWYRFLNDFSLSGASEQIHISDIYANSLFNQPALISEINIKANKNSGVAIQPWSSDAKKDWQDSKWIEFIKIFKSYEPNQKIDLIFGPENTKRFEKLSASLSEQGLDVVPVCLPIDQLADHLKQNCNTIISVDTGIKHLAAELGVKVFELSFGGSDYKRTGVYQKDALIFHANEQCYPCPVGSDCGNQHQCASKTMASDVAAIAFEFYRNQWNNIQSIAEEAKEDFSLYKVHYIKGYGFHALPIGTKPLAVIFDSILFKMTASEVLNRDSNREIEASASIALEVRKLSADLLNSDPLFSLNAYFGDVEKRTRKIESLIDDTSKSLRNDLQSSSKDDEFQLQQSTILKVKEIETQLQLGNYISQFLTTPSFYNIRRALSIMEEINSMQKLIWKSIRSYSGIKGMDLR